MFKQYFKNKRMKKGAEIEDSIMTITQEEKAIIEAPFKKQGLAIVWYLMVFLILALGGRMFYLDYYKGQYYDDVSRGNRIRSIAIKAPRGNILDKNGKVLARNAPSMDAIIIPSNLPTDQGDIKKIAQEVSDILGMNSGNVEAILESQDRKSPDPVLLQENISQEYSSIRQRSGAMKMLRSSLPSSVMTEK
jgi:cell division protein FtsI/penicillin-binding protein 2